MKLQQRSSRWPATVPKTRIQLHWVKDHPKQKSHKLLQFGPSAIQSEDLSIALEYWSINQSWSDASSIQPFPHQSLQVPHPLLISDINQTYSLRIFSPKEGMPSSRGSTWDSWCLNFFSFSSLYEVIGFYLRFWRSSTGSDVAAAGMEVTASDNRPRFPHLQFWASAQRRNQRRIIKKRWAKRTSKNLIRRLWSLASFVVAGK